MRNKQVKQMICTICEVKMKLSDPDNTYTFKFGKNGLGFDFNNSGWFLKAYQFGVVSITKKGERL
ncbi:hypothetical protein [Aliivibrio wodanis]|uniref:hypothetical protein n=1 Tax=Aliivibrio wodanis TaxID=80852 RepID=UPI00406D153D